MFSRCTGVGRGKSYIVLSLSEEQTQQVMEKVERHVEHTGGRLGFIFRLKTAESPLGHKGKSVVEGSAILSQMLAEFVMSEHGDFINFLHEEHPESCPIAVPHSH